MIVYYTGTRRGVSVRMRRGPGTGWTWEEEVVVGGDREEVPGAETAVTGTATRFLIRLVSESSPL
jgi:hypothetical protein